LTIFSNNKNVNFLVEFNDAATRELWPEYGDEYFLLLRRYFREAILTLPNVTLNYDQNYPYIEPEKLLNILSIKEKSMAFINPVPDSYIQHSDYVILNTIVISGIDKDIFYVWNDVLRYRLFDLLRENSTRALIIDEREYSDCFEYRIHGTFSVYKDIIEANLPGLIDLTVNDTY
jgi:hypothetical protein